MLLLRKMAEHYEKDKASELPFSYYLLPWVSISRMLELQVLGPCVHLKFFCVFDPSNRKLDTRNSCVLVGLGNLCR